MRFKIKFENTIKDLEKEPIHNAKFGIKVYDGDDNEYDISLNELGELTITGNDSKLMIFPRVSNVITLKQK